jgi:uncharacterized protein YggE
VTISDALAGKNKQAVVVLSALKGNGIQQRDIQTTQLNIDPVMARQDPDDTHLRKIVGYRARNGLSAKLRDIRGAGAVIDAAVQAGGDATRIAVGQRSASSTAPHSWRPLLFYQVSPKLPSGHGWLRGSTK